MGAFATEALALMLVQSGSRVVGVYADPRSMCRDLDARIAEIQVALLDADDRACGVAAVADLRRAHPRLKILVLCDALTPSLMRCAIEERIEGVVLKSDTVEDVIVALAHVSSGRSVMPAGWQAVPAESDRDPIETLSTREREVLELAAAGLQNREIAERLMISSNTVKFHLRAIYARLGVRNRVQAMHAVRASESDG
ncbi:MAG TPA: response regulator transcription factor [Solirubrobacteraceae bacterium]